MNPFGQQLQQAILAIVLVLLGIGLVMIYSTSAMVAEIESSTQDGYFFIEKQLFWCLVAIACMLAAMDFSYQHLQRYGYWIFALALLLLVLVLIPGIGVKYNGARRWIRFAGIGGQPSDFMKLAMVIFIATYAHRNYYKLKYFWAGFAPVFSLVALCCLLILLEPDFGTCCFIFAVALTLLLIAGIRWQHLVPLVLGGFPFVFVLAWSKFGHIKARIAVFLNPELDPLGKGYQIRQSLIALGSGGYWGVGLGWSQQKLFFLSEESTDFIFAIIGEELGFLGTSLIICLYILLIYYCIKVIRHAPDAFAQLLALGITGTICLQAAFNIAVVSQAVPAKGISLPLISFGGSGLLFTLIGIGILLNIAGQCRKEQGEGKNRPLRILFAGGGTGGHLLPGVALAQELQKRTGLVEVLFLVPGKPADLKIMKAYQFPWQQDPMRPFPRQVWRTPIFLVRFLLSFYQVEKILCAQRPDLIVGLGSYGSLSSGYLARFHQIPLVLLESNSSSGKVIRRLANWAKAVYSLGPVQGIASEKIVPLGVPLRPEIARAKRIFSKKNKLHILVMGGSQGAGCINSIMVQVLPLLEGLKEKIVFTHLAGKSWQGAEEYHHHGFEAYVYEFYQDMASLYQSCDLVICRAGGGTLAEITALGLPSIVIPFARSANNHQLENARHLQNNQAAVVIEEKDLSADRLADQIAIFVNQPMQLRKMADQAREMGKPFAGQKIAQHLVEIINQSNTLTFFRENSREKHSLYRN